MERERNEELARRLALLDRAGDQAFGVIGRVELTLGLVATVVVPLLIVWLAR